MAKAKAKVPKHQQGRIKQRLNVTLDPATISELERIKTTEYLESLSQVIRWLVSRHRKA